MDRGGVVYYIGLVPDKVDMATPFIARIQTNLRFVTTLHEMHNAQGPEFSGRDRASET